MEDISSARYSDQKGAPQMSTQFAKTLKRLRTKEGLSQKDLAEILFVSRSTVAKWENGSRLPDAPTISKIAKCLNVDVYTLMNTEDFSDESPNVIMVDDRRIILTGGLPVLEEVLPYASVTGFTRPSEAIEYAKAHPVSLAFLDIEMGKTSGFELCRTLLEINPRTNVVFLTAYSDYAVDAWSTGASGFLLKPITPEGVQEQLNRLRYPFSMGEKR
jgi:DNA-binding NarL/FixJ family response regulator